MQSLNHLDAFTLAHMLAFLDHASLTALTLTGHACGASEAPIRQLFLRRSCIRIPETLSSTSSLSSSSSLSAPLAAVIAMIPMSIDEDTVMDETIALALLHALLERPEVTKLSIKCSESDLLWVDALAQFLTPEVANKVTMVRVKQALVSNSNNSNRQSANSSSRPSGQQQQHFQEQERDDAAPVPIVHAILSRMRRNHQQTAEERAQVAHQWLQFASLMPNLKELDLSLIKCTTIEWLPALAKLEKLTLDAAELADQASLAPLRLLTNVKSLSVQNYMVPHIQEIAAMQQLQSLWFNESSVLEDLSSIRHLKRLQELKVTHMAAVQDLGFVHELSELRVLKVNFVGQDNQWLRLPELRVVSPSGSNEDDQGAAASPAPLLNLPHLHTLTLQRVRLYNLNVLMLCPNLKRLSLHAHDIISIEMLAAVSELRNLKLSIDIIGGRKLDLSPLTTLSKLLSLELVTLRGRFNSDTLPALPSLKTLVVPAMDDFEPICQRQSALSSLTVRECSQVDIDYAPVLSDLPMLTKLTLTFPVIKGRSESGASARVLDLSPLQSLTEMRSLCLIHMSSEDLSPLSALTKLKSLDLSAFYSTQPLASTILDFTPLTSLVNLRSLSVAGRSEFTESDLELLRNCSTLPKLRRINTTELVIPSFSGGLW